MTKSKEKNMKPSERVHEIIKEEISKGAPEPDNDTELLAASVYGVLTYLDEEWTKNKRSKKKKV